MSFDVVWVPVGAQSRLAEIFGADTCIVLPHVIDDPNRHTPSGGLSTDISAETLTHGILLASQNPPPLAETGTSEQLLRVLKLISQDVGAPSEDELCTRAAGYFRDRHSKDVALKVLRRAVELVPHGRLVRADLIVSLFKRATSGSEGATEDLQEAADVFLAWKAADTSQCSNEELVIYCGLAALTYLGRSADLGSVVQSRPDFFHRSPWLEKQLRNLSSARAGHIEDIALDR